MSKIIKYKVDSKFEEAYLDARKTEQRILSLAQIKQLPHLENHPKAKEWQQRINSTNRFVDYIKSAKPQTVLDLACGNGWLSHKIAPLVRKLDLMDINLKELEQADELFENFDNVDIYYCDIMNSDFEKKYDLILINAAIQYFPNVKSLIYRLFDCLNTKGKIHILDSPFYKEEEVTVARKRSQEYYDSIDNGEMKDYYFHHSWEALSSFDYRILYQPNTLIQKIKRKIGITDSPFPWIEISK